MRNLILIIFFAAMFGLIGACAAVRQEPARIGIEDSIKNAESYLEVGEYKKAVELLAEAYGKYPDQGLLIKYLNVCDRVRSAADRIYQKKDFAKAGNLYTLLIQNKITETDSRKLLSFNDGYLKSQVKSCSKALTEAGLIKYREEKLSEAIALWEKVLAFDPQNASVMKAVETVNMQLRQLKSIR